MSMEKLTHNDPYFDENREELQDVNMEPFGVNGWFVIIVRVVPLHAGWGPCSD